MDYMSLCFVSVVAPVAELVVASCLKERKILYKILYDKVIYHI